MAREAGELRRRVTALGRRTRGARIPAELRAAHGWEAGTAVIAVDAPGGVLLLTLEEALDRIRNASTVSVDDFLAGRRAEKAAEEKEVVGWGASSSTPRP